MIACGVLSSVKLKKNTFELEDLFAFYSILGKWIRGKRKAAQVRLSRVTMFWFSEWVAMRGNRIESELITKKIN